MIKGNISSIETMGLVDGPGIRYVVFLQGCKLRCLFCHNPETWDTKEKLLMTPEELITKVLKYKNYYGKDGGITFSGGEPLLQPEFLKESLKLAKTCNLNTVIDTAGVGLGNYEEILKYTDLVILDIKAIDEESYQKITGQSMTEFNNFLSVCQRLNKKLWLRQVIIPGINDTEEYILQLKTYIQSISNIEKVELLPYHVLGCEKYKTLNIPYRLDNIPAMNVKKCEQLQELLEK